MHRNLILSRFNFRDSVINISPQGFLFVISKRSLLVRVSNVSIFMAVMLTSWKLCFLNLGARVTLCFAVPLYPPSPLQERRSLRYPLLKLFFRRWEKLKIRIETAAAYHVRLVTDWLFVTIPFLYSVTYQLVVTILFIYSLSAYGLVTIRFTYSLSLIGCFERFHSYAACHLLTRNDSIYVQPVSLLTPCNDFIPYVQVTVVVSSSPYLVHTEDLARKHINLPFKFI
jgi:hypothetical protein